MPISGSYAIPFGNGFATRVGWLITSGQPLVFLTAENEHNDAMVRQLIRIGSNRLHGFLDGGVEGWKSAGLPVEASQRMDLDSLHAQLTQPAASIIIDVRQRSEYVAGHIPRALNIDLGELQERLDGLPRELPIVTVCAAGMRATIAGSILHQDGRENVKVVDEIGTLAWIEKGFPSLTGEI